jgi:Predicted membrane-associated Zn-dependent proteases 1
VDSGAEQAGLEPWDVILSIDGEEVATTDDFSETMSELSANQTVVLQVKRYNDSTIENLNVTLTDKYQYYLDLGVDSEALDNLGIEPGDAFLGVNSLSDGTAGVDRLAGPYHSDFEGGVIDYAVNIPVHTMILLVTPFDLQGVAIHPAQEEMLGTGDGWLAQTLGLDGMLFLVNLIFWLIWVNILLGFTNLIPMVPFDGGHLFRDMVHGIMSGLRKLGKKTRLWKIHPLWIEHVSRKTSSFSSLILLLMLVFLIGSPYL